MLLRYLGLLKISCAEKFVMYQFPFFGLRTSENSLRMNVVVLYSILAQIFHSFQHIK